MNVCDRVFEDGGITLCECVHLLESPRFVYDLITLCENGVDVSYIDQ